MAEPSERDLAIWADAHTRYVLDRGGCQPTLPYDWSLVGMIAIATAREEGRREAQPITDAMVEAGARAAYAKDWEAQTGNLRDGHFDYEEEWVKTDWRNLARAALEAAERARG